MYEFDKENLNIYFGKKSSMYYLYKTPTILIKYLQLLLKT